jgi:hypothetical protein
MKKSLFKIITLIFCLNIFYSQNTNALGFFRGKTLIEQKEEKEVELSIIKEKIKELRIQPEINENQLKRLKTEFFKAIKELKEINTKIATHEAEKIKTSLLQTNQILRKPNKQSKRNELENLTKADFGELTQTIKIAIIEESKNILSEITNVEEIKAILESKLNLIIPRIIGTIISLTQNSDNPYHTIINNVAINIEKLWKTAQEEIKGFNLSLPKKSEPTTSDLIIKFDIFEEENRELVLRLEQAVDTKIDTLFISLEKIISCLDIRALERDTDELKKTINLTLDILIHHSFDLLTEISNGILIDWLFIQKDRLVLSSLIDNSLIMGKVRTAIETFLTESLDQLLIVTNKYRNTLLNDILISWIQVNILSALNKD